MSKGREGSDHRPNSQLPSDAVTGNVSSVTLPAVISLGGNRKGVSTCGHASRRYLYTWRTKSKFWCRGPESNWLRPPFQGGALPMSYPGFSTTYRRYKNTVSVVVSIRSPVRTALSLTNYEFYEL